VSIAVKKTGGLLRLRQRRQINLSRALDRCTITLPSSSIHFWRERVSQANALPSYLAKPRAPGIGIEPIVTMLGVVPNPSTSAILALDGTCNMLRAVRKIAGRIESAHFIQLRGP
jgi:hypothetical protein